MLTVSDSYHRVYCHHHFTGFVAFKIHGRAYRLTRADGAGGRRRHLA